MVEVRKRLVPVATAIPQNTPENREKKCVLREFSAAATSLFEADLCSRNDGLFVCPNYEPDFARTGAECIASLTVISASTLVDPHLRIQIETGRRLIWRNYGT